jgi:hypothetical protein
LWRGALQPGTEVFRFQLTHEIAGLPGASSTVRDPTPVTQSAELQIRSPP